MTLHMTKNAETSVAAIQAVAPSLNAEKPPNRATRRAMAAQGAETSDAAQARPGHATQTATPQQHQLRALVAAKLERLGFGDRFVFDEDLTAIDRMCRSARRNAINNANYPLPRRIGLRSAWLLSEVLAWMKARPTIYEKAGSGTSPRKAVS